MNNINVKEMAEEIIFWRTQFNNITKEVNKNNDYPSFLVAIESVEETLKNFISEEENEENHEINIEELVNRNRTLQKEHSFILEKHRKELKEIMDKVEAPCGFCKQDGQFRCEACAENFFEGYNISNYPR